MASFDVQAVFETVARRRQILELLDEDAVDKRTLVDRLGVSRSTVNRALRRLQGLDFVTYREGRYETTNVGELAMALFDETASCLDVLLSARRLLGRADPAFDPPVSLFRDATVVTTAEGRHSPARALVDCLLATEEVRTVGFPFRTDLPTPVREHLFVDGGGVTVRSVVSRQSLEWLRTFHAPELETVVGTDTHELRQTNERPATTCVLSGVEPSSVTVVFYDDNDAPAGIVTSNDPRAVGWATRRFDEAWRTSTPLEE